MYDISDDENNGESCYFSADIIKNTLKFTLNIDDTVNWDKLKDPSTFQIKEPSEPKLLQFPREPKKTDSKYNPHINIFDLIFTSLKEKKTRFAENIFNCDYEIWSVKCKSIEEKNKEITEENNFTVQEWEEQYSDFQKRQRKNSIEKLI